MALPKFEDVMRKRERENAQLPSFESVVGSTARSSVPSFESVVGGRTTQQSPQSADETRFRYLDQKYRSGQPLTAEEDREYFRMKIQREAPQMPAASLEKYDPNVVRPPTPEEAEQLQEYTERRYREGFGSGRLNPIARRAIEQVGGFAIGAVDSATMGLADRLTGGGLSELAGERGRNVGRTIGEIVGQLAPIGAAYRLTRGISRLIPTQNRIVQNLARGAAAGATYSTAEELADAALDTRRDEDQSLGERVRNVALQTALFAGGDALLSGLGRLARRGLESIRARRAQPFQANLEDIASRLKTEDDALSFRAKVNRTPRRENRFQNLWLRLRTQFVDDLAPLEQLERNVRGRIASAEDSLYKQARLFRGSPTKANEIVRTRLAPIIQEIEERGFTYQDLGDYALAVHARDVNRRGLKSGFTDQEIEAVIRKYGTPEMEEARKKLVQVSNEMLNMLADSGVISKETVQTLREKWPNYMPLFRSFDDEKVEFESGLSQALANVTNPIKKLKGSERQVIDPLESMVKNIFQATNAADRNAVARQLAKLADEDKEGMFVRRLADDEAVGRKNVVSVLEDGKKVRYEVEPEVYRAMLNLDRESSNFLIRILQKPASVLRAGATLTPEFSLRNPMRDVLQAYVVSQSKFNPFVDFPVALIQAIFKGRKVKLFGKEFDTPGKLYQQFLEDNGGFGNIVSMDRNVHREALERVLKQPVSKTFVNIVTGRSLIQLLRAIADVSETATKLGEYRAALRQGVSRQEAAYRARDIMDFARSGSAIRNANKVVAFLNANIQGKSKLIRAIKENPVGVTLRALKAVTLPTIGVFLAQRYMANEEQRKIIDDAPDWLKNSFWLIPIPGTNQVARIPKPFDLSIFANLPERLLDYFAKNDPQSFDDFAKETFASYSVPVMMTGLVPIIEGMANYSFFRQAPIIPTREQNIDFPDQYDVNTSQTAIGLARAIHALTGGEGALRNFGSPRIVENTIRGLTGGLGTYATDAIDALLEGMGAVDRPEKPERAVSQQPLIRAFLVNTESTGKSMDRLYDLVEKLRREKGSAELRKEPFRKNRELKFAENATEQIGKISKRMRQIQNDERLSAERKRELLQELNDRRNEIARKAMERLQNVQ